MKVPDSDDQMHKWTTPMPESTKQDAALRWRISRPTIGTEVISRNLFSATSPPFMMLPRFPLAKKDAKTILRQTSKLPVIAVAFAQFLRET